MVSGSFKVIVASVLWAYQVIRYRAVIGPPINILSQARAITLDVRGVLKIPHRLEIRAFHDGCISHLINRFYEIELGLNFTS